MACFAPHIEALHHLWLVQYNLSKCVSVVCSAVFGVHLEYTKTEARRIFVVHGLETYDLVLEGTRIATGMLLFEWANLFVFYVEL